MMGSRKCSICLKKYKTVSVEVSDKSNVKWLSKLQYTVPELEWFEEYVICRHCTKQLQRAWEFKKFVLNLEQSRRSEVMKIESYVDAKEHIADSCDTEYCDSEETKIECNLCFKIFTNDTQLNQHKQIHTEIECKASEEYIFTCYNCNISFNTKNKLIYHIETEHKRDVGEEEENLYDLSKDYVSSEYELHHTATQSVSKFLDNDLTNLVSNTKKDNLRNESTKVPPTKKRRGRKPLRKFYCEICNEEFEYLKLITDHCISMHGMNVKDIKPYLCEKCDMRFVSSANLDQHRNYHNKNRTHICTSCGKGFITKSDLTVHEHIHYNRRNYKCTICDKGFNTNKNLRTHDLVVHTDRSLWKHVCTICGKRFPLKANFDQHFRRHTGEKEYSCHICRKSFISKSELQRHGLMHSNIRAFKCTHCHKEYKEKRTYNVHLAQKHGIGNAKVTVREKKFVCHICPSQFYDKQKLMRHICSHSGVKPFSCYACDKKFTDKYYLKHHLKVTHNILEQSDVEYGQ